MKTHLHTLVSKINFWSLFIGLVVGFGLGVTLINALVPNANQLIYLYHMDRESLQKEKGMRMPLVPQGDRLEVNANSR